MRGSRFVDHFAVVAFALAAFSLAGCASRYSTETKIGGRPVAYRSTTEKAVLLKVINQDEATFAVGQFRFTINRARVTWGQGQALALPDDWRRVDFINQETHIAVEVDGRPHGEIRPAAYAS